MPRRKSDFVMGIDLGGTKILAAVVDARGRILGRAKRPTDAQDGPPKVLKRMAECALEAAARGGLSMQDIRGVGIGAPGPLDPGKGLVIFAPNLFGWKDVPVKRSLERSLERPVFLDNDVNVGTLGEHSFGAGKGVGDLVGIFVGTGIGGGVILNGRLHRGFNKTAGEVGHMIVQINGPLCGCGNRGCLESIASRTAITRDISAAARKNKKGKNYMARFKNPFDLRSGDLARALGEGDKVVRGVVKCAAEALGVCTVNIIHFLNPEMVILGGGVMEAFGEHILPVVRKVVKRSALPLAGDNVQIVPALLGDDACVLGAAVLARQRLS